MIRYCVTRELTYTAYGTESTACILHPPRHIILGNRVLSRPLHDRCYFFAERLKNIFVYKCDGITRITKPYINRVLKNILPFSTFFIITLLFVSWECWHTVGINCNQLYVHYWYVQKIDPLVSRLPLRGRIICLIYAISVRAFWKIFTQKYF